MLWYSKRVKLSSFSFLRRRRQNCPLPKCQNVFFCDLCVMNILFRRFISNFVISSSFLDRLIPCKNKLLLKKTTIYISQSRLCTHAIFFKLSSDLHACGNNAKIVRNRDAQCNTEDSFAVVSYEVYFFSWLTWNLMPSVQQEKLYMHFENTPAIL